MQRLGALGFVVALGFVTWFAPAGGAGAQNPPRAQLLSVDRLAPRYGRGVARIKGGWVLNGASVMARTDEGFHEQQINRSPIPQRLLREGYRRMGDVDVVGMYVYAALEMRNTRLDNGLTVRYDLKTLKYVDSVELQQHASSFVAIEPLRMIGYAMDRSNGKVLLRYDVVRDWKPLPRLVLDRTLVDVRGGAVGGGAVWISTSDRTKEIYRVDERTGHVDDIGSAGNVMVEGIDAKTIHDANIHVTTIDRRHHRVRLLHFKVS
jgi:hypothetical protein